MKKLFPAALAAVLFFAACSKKEGPVGPAGPQGPAGAQGLAGATGAQGAPGNANVTVYMFSDIEITGGGQQLHIKPVTKGKMDSSLVLVYYNPAGEPDWFPVPGAGPDNLYHTRTSVVPAGYNTGVYGINIRLDKADGTPYKTAVTFKKIRVFLVQATSIIPMGKQAAPDLRDYESVRRYYNIED